MAVRRSLGSGTLPVEARLLIFPSCVLNQAGFDLLLRWKNFVTSSAGCEWPDSQLGSEPDACLWTGISRASWGRTLHVHRRSCSASTPRCPVRP